MPAKTTTTKEAPEEEAGKTPSSLSEALDMLPGSVMQSEANDEATADAEKAAKEAERAEAKAAKQAEVDDDVIEGEAVEVSSTDERPVSK